MLAGVFSTFRYQDVVPILLQGLQHLELEYGNFDGVGIATLMDGRIQHQYTQGTGQDLQRILQKQPLSGRFGIAYTHQNSAACAGMCACDHMHQIEKELTMKWQIIKEEKRVV